MRAILFILLFCVVSASGANKFLRQGASGAGNGNNWTDAYTTTSAAESGAARDDTVWVADGTYSGGVFNTALSGTTLITWKKAIVADHGSDTGWDNAYGDGQAVFTSKMEFDTGYWTFDGQTGGGPGSWTTGFGFKIEVTDACSGPGVRADTSNSHHITFLHTEIQGNGGDGAPAGCQANDGFQILTGGDTITARYMYIHDMGRCPFKLSGGGGNLFAEYVYTGVFESTSAQHAEIASLDDTQNNTFANCIFTWFEGTGGLIQHGPGLTVYGSVFANRNAAFAGANGQIGTWSAGTLNDVIIYNNSFLNCERALFTPDSNWTVYNNIFYDVKVGLGGMTHDFNHFIDLRAGSSIGDEANDTSGSGDPFVDAANDNFHLAAATAAGKTDLGSPYNVDADGETRGSDGTYDRGAYEFGGTPDVTDPVISNISSGTPGSTTATITWTTDEAADSEVEYGLTASYGSSVSDGSLLVSHSIGLTGLSAGTTYHYRVISCDGSGNCAESADQTFATAAADSTNPTVSITNPTDMETVSETVSFSADASDNQAVASVRFYVDDVLQSTDTESAYFMQWNTRNHANGSHTLKAVAEDTSGNTALDEITVTISNDALSGPAVWWKFDENTGTTSTDTVAANVLTLRNGATWGVGRSGSALSLDGVNDRGDAPNSASLDISGGEITVMAWVKITSTATWQQFVAKVKEEGAFTSPFYAWHLYGGHESATEWRPLFQITDSSDTRYNAGSATLVPYGSWVHIAGVYNGSEVAIFVNGVDSGGIEATGNLKSYAQPLYIGATGLPGEFTEGLIEDVRIYNRALSGSEITSIYGNSTMKSFGGRLQRGGRRR